MERIAHVFRVKPGLAEEYARRHRTVWPELEALLREAGVRRYAIYAWGDLLFSYMEVKGYRAMVDRFNANPVAQRWEKEFSDILEYPAVDPETQWPVPLQEVWNLEPIAAERGG